MQNKFRKVKQYILELDANARYLNQIDVENIEFFACDYKSGQELPSLDKFKPFGKGEYWGEGWDTHAWFHFKLNIPAHMIREDLAIQLHIGTDTCDGWDPNNPQFLIYIDGKLRQGMDINHTYIEIDPAAENDIYLYAYTGARVDKSRLFLTLRNVNKSVEALWYDLRVPFEVLELLDERTLEYANILRYLDEAVSMLELYDIKSAEFFESVERARAYMADEFYDKYCKTQPETVICIGHTHIDCAWVWTLKQTREKVQRSFCTVLDLMKKYPEYKFMSSQAHLYRDLKEEAPEKFEEIKQRIAEGRWECEGAMWVEADCNLSSGESLVRQVLYGKRFFKNEFGVNSRVLWLPDVFGYSAALPQILKKSGVDWFVTSKISWNDDNTMPYDTFEWYGIDGTPINTYFLTAQNYKDGWQRGCSYNGCTSPNMLKGTSYRYQQKLLTNETIDTFGFGDGGGGPTIEYLEYYNRQSKGIPGVPTAKMEFAGDFLSRLEKKIEGNKYLPKWRGELYLEFHRGTYTSVAKNKKNNRKSEFLYLDAELLGTIGKDVLGKEFDKAALHKGWEMILSNQFHDIIPGSSIDEVYDQSDKDYAWLMDVANEQINATRGEIASKISKNEGYVVFNPHSFTGNGLVKLDGKSAIVTNIAKKGYSCVKSFKATNSIIVTADGVETNALKVKFNKAWQIVSIYDKANDREIIKNGGLGNELRIYADRPDSYDCWEWQAYSTEKYKSLDEVSAVDIVDDGVRLGIKIVRPFMQSEIAQTIWFYDDIMQIDFETEVDWHQNSQMLKTAFEVDINADKATYEIQFGTIERPTHKNTSWDAAKFEVCAHKYADISEGGYGVSLINDCKYGHDIHDGVMQLSLLKCGIHPSKRSDHGKHSFTYSICPHSGTFASSDVPERAYMLNYPMTAVKACGNESVIPTSYSAVAIDKSNVICETVKEAEDSLDTIVRLYECKNIRTKASVSVGFKASECYICDLLENELEALEIKDGCVNIDVGGYEIVTLKFKK